MKVLVAEDDLHIREGLVDILVSEGYTVLQADNGVAAFVLWQQHAPDFVCLDVMMPGMSGYDVCKKIRASDRDVPVVFISAKSEEIDKVVGLELGADDYIVKPFGVREVAARVRAITRRCLARAPEIQRAPAFRIGDWEVFPDELRACRDGGSIELSLRETRLLELFARSPGKVLSRDQIFDQCWGASFFPLSRTLDQHIAKLRKRIERDPKTPRIIETVHGVGYRYPG